MNGKLRLGKTSTSRTRAKAKSPVLSQEALELKQRQALGYTDFIDSLLAKGFSSSTVKRYVIDATRFNTWASEENLSPQTARYADLLHYIQTQSKRIKQKSLASHLNGLKHYFSYLEASRERIDNPLSQITIKGIKRKSLYQPIKRPDLESLYANFPVWAETSGKRPVSQRNKVMLGMLIFQGINSNELGCIKASDVHIQEGTVYIAGGRRSNERTLRLEAVQMFDLMEYHIKTRQQLLQHSQKQSHQLFVSTGKSQNLYNVSHKLLGQLHQINPQITSLKQIRTSVIVHWLKAYNLREAQYMAGHRYVSSTEGYLANDLDDMQNEIGKYHPIG